MLEHNLLTLSIGAVFTPVPQLMATEKSVNNTPCLSVLFWQLPLFSWYMNHFSFTQTAPREVQSKSKTMFSSTSCRASDRVRNRKTSRVFRRSQKSSHVSTRNKNAILIKTTATQDNNMSLRKTNVNPHPGFMWYHREFTWHHIQDNNHERVRHHGHTSVPLHYFLVCCMSGRSTECSVQ